MSFTSQSSRWSDVYLVVGSRALSGCGDFLAATTLALVLQGAGHGGVAISALMLAAGVPPVLLAPLSGRLADLADSRVILAVTAAAQAAVCVALAFVSHPVLIIALVALLACGLAFTGPVLSALLPEMVRREDLAKASGISQTAGQIGVLIGPALAGVLVGQTGSRVPLLIDAATYLALVVAALAIRTRRRGGGVRSAVPLEPWRLRDDRTLAVVVGLLAAVVLAIAAINVFDVFFVRETLGASATVYGFVAASWTVGMLLGSVTFSRFPSHRITPFAMLAVTAATCVPFIGAAFVGDALWLIPFWIVGGLFNGAINVFVMVFVTSRTPPAARGRAFAGMNAPIQGAGMVGLLVAGPLVGLVDLRVLIASAGAAGLLTALAALLVVRREPPSAPGAGGSHLVRDSVGA
ncbi:MFS transporter [Paractinoplanes atraurantiacus]|uniref:Predicted arabinose efflux permease, MFS family n=1 Tax=Paractinoplanes atraurantiacus TaxID=1036182 RepID=A0A285K661_9ACTN|nr:MFS transporter [Actinoplanes atraurantiacus]SNY68038.1 Predicted arabinose efflux permease, MFS family [Actinoplanes atraurantiacus]